MDDFEEDGPTLTIECRACGAEVYEDAVVCPVCNEYITHGGSAFRRRPLWFLVLGGMGILAVIWMLLT